MSLKVILLHIWWTSSGCKMGAYGEARECPRCGVLVENAEHCCGDQDKRKRKANGERAHTEFGR